ncbi:hypothetical protein CVT25_002511 [Psilocybe cyanescens]|uniref:Uncharacterized protein n=1 Tax=Psilocybe cyanescens TaxID=93625 RepID=A0A409XUB5_PSICY|nr:hypothetical protein CVT25_002511 [Psilocybe cyanescens]
MSTFASEIRKAEMARLFDLFEKLKSRRARPTSIINEDAPMEDVRPVPTPTPTPIVVLDPAMKKLSSIVDRSSTSTRPRRNTVASIIAQGGDMMSIDEGHSDSDAESQAKSPLAERKKFPFTFKHMVHKLYEKDDWARTVKEMLEKSQNEFKPLAEQQQALPVTQNENERENLTEDGEGEEMGKDNIIRFKIPTSPGARRRGSFTGGRQRSLSIATTGGGRGYTPLSPGLRSPGFKPPVIKSPGPGIKSPGVEGRPDLRAVKKRCVSRRKSASGLVSGGAGKPSGIARGAWVYNAAIALSERPVPTTFAAFPPGPPPSPTGGKAASSRYQALGTKNLPSAMHEGGIGMKRRVVPATDAPVATTFAAFPHGPPLSPTGGKGSSSKYQALGMKNLPTTMQGGGMDMKHRIIPATDAPVATTFAAFPPGPPPSPTGVPRGSLLQYQTLGTKKLPSTLKERGTGGLKRRVSGGGEVMPAVPLLMPLQQVTNIDANGLAARRRSRMASKTDDEKDSEQKIEQKSPNIHETIA